MFQEHTLGSMEALSWCISKSNLFTGSEVFPICRSVHAHAHHTASRLSVVDNTLHYRLTCLTGRSQIGAHIHHTAFFQRNKCYVHIGHYIMQIYDYVRTDNIVHVNLQSQTHFITNSHVQFGAHTLISMNTNASMLKS